MVTCNSCGRQFNWRAHQAGRQFKCMCGAPIVVPAQDPDAADPAAAAQTTKLVTAAAILAMIFVLAGVLLGVQHFAAEASAPEPNEPALPGLDGRVVKLMQQNGSEEVLAWLKENTGRGIVGFYWTRELTAKYAQQWYDHGAKNVLAFGDPFTTRLAIELPDDKSKRRYFFDYANNFRLQFMGVNPSGRLSPQEQQELNERFPPQTEMNQKYVLLDFLPSRPAGNGMQLPF